MNVLECFFFSPSVFYSSVTDFIPRTVEFLLAYAVSPKTHHLLESVKGCVVSAYGPM